MGRELVARGEMFSLLSGGGLGAMENVFLSAFIAEGYGRCRGISVAARVFARTTKLVYARRAKVAKEDRGFASMDRNKQREIASKGGKAAHQKGTAHEWTSEEAREAGRKGGMASHRRKQQQGGGEPGAMENPRDTGEQGGVFDIPGQ